MRPESSRTDDPERLRSETWVRFFDMILSRRLASSFHALRLALPGAPSVPDDLPLIVYANHPSWWDAALLPVILRRLYPTRRAFAPMDAKAIQQYGFMRRIGLFGVDQESYKGAAVFLRRGEQLLQSNDVVLCVTAQTGFSDARERPLKLRAGLAHLLSRAPRVTVLPLAMEYPFWTESTPEALARFGEPLEMGPHVGKSSDEIAVDLEARLSAAMDALALDAMSRDASRFTTLIGGRVGVGGVYDMWRRLVARFRGEAFDAAHSPTTRP